MTMVTITVWARIDERKATRYVLNLTSIMSLEPFLKDLEADVANLSEKYCGAWIRDGHELVRCPTCGDWVPDMFAHVDRVCGPDAVNVDEEFKMIKSLFIEAHNTWRHKFFDDVTKAADELFEKLCHLNTVPSTRKPKSGEDV